MTVDLTYGTVLSRVRLSATGLAGSPTSATVERSIDGIRWTTVRGGASVAVSAGAVSLDDYEFVDRVANTYRVTAYDGGGVQVDQESASITPALDGVWLKSLARPFLNRVVQVRGYGEVTRRSRAGVFDVIGRSYPIAVTEVRGSRQWVLEVVTDTTEDASDLDLLLASGDVLLVHVPAASGRVSAVPGGYVAVGDVRLVTPPTVDLVQRVFALPCVEVAAPGPDVVGATSTWQTVLSTYATWADVMAEHATWADLMELVGDPTDVIVP
ncbi:hypothetical protein ACIBCR_16355 [Micromonospora echinospora]|uniref:hypothetical protein n=1 Tax=Micromonospora echinospora TaxID=1877 RepID=UPI0037BDE62F